MKQTIYTLHCVSPSETSTEEYLFRDDAEKILDMYQGNGWDAWIEEREVTQAVFINGSRNAYSPDQVETMTVGELAEMFRQLAECYGEDAPVFLRNDNGYTYGSIRHSDINEGNFDDHGHVELGEEW